MEQAFRAKPTKAMINMGLYCAFKIDGIRNIPNLKKDVLLCSSSIKVLNEAESLNGNGLQGIHKTDHLAC